MEICAELVDQPQGEVVVITESEDLYRREDAVPDHLVPGNAVSVHEGLSCFANVTDLAGEEKRKKTPPQSARLGQTATANGARAVLTFLKSDTETVKLPLELTRRCAEVNHINAHPYRRNHAIRLDTTTKRPSAV